MSDGMVIITFKLPYRLLEELDRYAIVEGLSRSEVIRRAVVEYLAKHATLYPMQTIRVRRVVLT